MYFAIEFYHLVPLCEQEFGIKLGNDELQNLCIRHIPHRTWFGSETYDVRVRDLVTLVAKHIQSENPNFDGTIFERMKDLIADCLSIEDAEIAIDSWFIEDLGMHRCSPATWREPFLISSFFFLCLPAVMLLLLQINERRLHFVDLLVLEAYLITTAVLVWLFVEFIVAIVKLARKLSAVTLGAFQRLTSKRHHFPHPR